VKLSTDLQAMLYVPGVSKPRGLMTSAVEAAQKRRKAAPMTRGNIWGAVFTKRISQTQLRRMRRLVRKRAQAACLSTRYILQHPGDKMPDGRPKMTRAEARSHNRFAMQRESRRRNHVSSA